RGHAVIDDHDPSVAADEVGSVVGTVEAERLAQLGGSAAEIAVTYGSRAAAAPHHIECAQRFGGPEQHGDTVIDVTTHRVGAPVHAVREVHVQPARRDEHRRVAW